MPAPNDLIGDARRHAIDICTAQLADSADATHRELLRVLDAIGDDANQIYALYRVLMGAVAASVMVTAEDTADDPQSQRANAVTIVRDLINNLELGIR